MVDKSNREVACWAITQNERLYDKMDAIAERSVVISWSLGNIYRSERCVQATGCSSGLREKTAESPVSDSSSTRRRRDPGFATGNRHKAGYWGRFYLPPFPIAVTSIICTWKRSTAFEM